MIIPVRRVKRRFVLPALLVVVGAGFFARDVWRVRPQNLPDPTEPASGVRCAVRLLPDGHRPVRCTMVLGQPMERVWSVITDYDHYQSIFPYLSAVKTTREAPTRYRLQAVARTPLYTSWPFELVIDQRKEDILWGTTWDEPGAGLSIDRGSWMLTPLGPERTLLAYTLELRVRWVPDLLTDNILLDHLPKVLQAVNWHLGGQGRR